jgi:hypothetical protein
VIQLGNLRVNIGGSVKPKELPRHARSPISLRIEGRVRTLDGSLAPGLRTMVIDLDRNATVDTRGLPTCSEDPSEGALTDDALRRCERALVGKGVARAIINSPDQGLFEARGPLLAFNGEGAAGGRVVLFYAPEIPTATTWLARATISKSPGRAFGERVAIEVAPIAGDTGHLIDLEVKLRRTWRHEGRERSYLRARCPSGHLVTRTDLWLLDGSRLNGAVVRRCHVSR